MLRVKRLHERAVIPKRFEGGSLPDLFSVQEQTVAPRAIEKFSTGLLFELPPSTFGLILNRSSYALRGLSVPCGLIDSSYRGEVKWDMKEARRL